jgi:hypothetical protein
MLTDYGVKSMALAAAANGSSKLFLITLAVNSKGLTMPSAKTQ